MSPTPYYLREAPGTITVTMEDGGPVLHLRGDIDLAAVSDYEANPSRDQSIEGRVVAIDAAKVTFFGSSGIRSSCA